MILDECIESVTKAAGRELTQAEVKQLGKELEQRVRAAQAATSALPFEEAALKAADELGQQLKLAAVIEKRNALINLRRRTEALAFVKASFADNPALGLRSILTGTQRARVGARRSVAAEQEQLRGKYLGGLIADLEKTGALHVLASGAADRDITRALWRIEDPTPDFQGLQPEAVELAKAIRKWQEVARLDANKAGAWIGKLPGYVVRQSHDMWKIRAAGFDAWKAEILPKLDLEKTLANVGDEGAQNADEWLREVYTGLATGQHLKSGPDAKAGAFRGPANLAKRLSQERSLHYKDADAWHEYNQKFGTGNLREALFHGLTRGADSTGLMRVLGTNPGSNFDQLVDRIAKGLRRDPEKLASFMNDVGTAQAPGAVRNRLMQVDGTTRIPVNQMLARAAASARAIETMAKLGGSVISSFSDIPVYASEMRYQGRGFLSGIAEAVGGLLSGRPKGEQREILSSLGVVFDSMVGEITRWGAHDDSAPGRLSRITQTFFKLNLQSWWTDSLLSSAALSMSHDLGQHMGTAFKDLRPEVQRALGLYGISEPEWNAIGKVEARTAEDGRAYLTPEHAAQIADSDIDKVIAPRIAEINQTTDRVIERTQAANERDRGWVEQRAARLREQLAAATERLNDRIAKVEGGAAEGLRDIKRRLGELYSNIDAAKSFWNGVRESQPSIAEMRREGIKEGRARDQAAEAQALREQVLGDLESVKGDLESGFVERMREKLEAIPEVVRRLRTDQNLRTELEAMRNETGWAEVGGRVLMDDAGNVLGRTHWIPRAEWWRERPKGLTEEQVHAATDKALAGSKLSKRQLRMVEFMRDVADERARLAEFLPTKEELQAEGLRGTDDSHEAAMVARAAELDENIVEKLAVQHEEDADAFLAAIKKFLDENDPAVARGAAGEGAPEKEGVSAGESEPDFEAELGSVFTEAKAALNARIQKLDGVAAKRVERALERLGRAETQFVESAKFFQRMKDAQPKQAALRGVGVHEGRALQMATQMKADARAIGRDLERFKKDVHEDFITTWSARQEDLVAFADGTQERMRARDELALEYSSKVGDRIERARAEWRETLEGKLRSFFLDRARTAVLHPDAETLALMRQGTRPGTVSGEAARFIGQFKSFSIAYLQKIVGREVYGRGSDTLAQAMRNGNGEMLGLANIILWTTAFGYAAMATKDLLKGRTPRDPENYKTWMAALTQGGGLGIYGDFLFGEANRFGGGLWSSALGPVAGTANDVYDLYQRVKAGDDASAQAFRVVMSNTPFLNLFYTRTALDYLLLYRIQEALNPGYLRRLERRVEKENGQTFWLRPSEVAQ